MPLLAGAGSVVMSGGSSASRGGAAAPRFKFLPFFTMGPGPKKGLEQDMATKVEASFEMCS